MSEHTPPSSQEDALRAFAREINHATHTVRDTDGNCPTPTVLLPTGVTARRLFVVGALVDATGITETDTATQGRIINPTGILFIHPEDGQSKAAQILQEIDLPTYVGVVGSPRLSMNDDGTTYVSLQPEHLLRVDEARRNQWLRETARRTVERIEAFEERATEEAVLARTQYGPDIEPYRQAVDTARDVSGDMRTEEKHL